MNVEAYPIIVIAGGIRRRKIPQHDLSIFIPPTIPGNRGVFWRMLWYVVNATVFQGSILSLVPRQCKATILRVFGAKIGRRFVCKPRVSIKYPWFLEISDDVWLGEMVWIDNHCQVKIGNSVCVSQGSYIFTGNHNWNDVAFRFFTAPVAIGDGAWLGACSRVGPGSDIPNGTVLTAGTEWSASMNEKRNPTAC